MQKALDYANAHFDAFVDQLIDILKIPSISADSAYTGDVRRAAQWLVDEFQRIGMQRAELLETPGHPVVYAEYKVDPALPTVLCYGHYDVQPPDPLKLWHTQPFEPTLKNGNLYARGACDDKGQSFMHLKAAESYLQATGRLPLNLKFIIEGEEEVGSEHLESFLQAHRELLEADVVLISDTSMFAPGVPSITVGLRGLAYTEVELIGPERDLHSGSYGGPVENPLNALARLIAGLHDENHHITIPGFYDNVRDLTEEERTGMRSLPFDEDAWMHSIGIEAVKPEAGYTVLEAKSARPTLDVNGIWGGYQGEGAKTVLPSRAGAKISMRLVPDQRPDEIYRKIQAYFEANTPPTMKLKFQALHGGMPVLVDVHTPAMQAAVEALEGTFGQPSVFTREGGSIPIVADFKRILGLDSVLMGFGLNTDALHSPNEHFGLDRFKQGILTVIRFFEVYARRGE